MEVTLDFNGKKYTLKLHELDIWTHTASVSTPEMTTFIQDILANNPDMKQVIIGGVANAKK